MSVQICPGCGVELPATDGPMHKYMESSPACWAAYGRVLAREYSDSRYAARHQLTVDTYAVQHPGKPSAQSTQSVGLHLMGLCLSLEHGAAPSATRSLLQASNAFKEKLVWQEPPPTRGRITVVDLGQTSSPEAHLDQVMAWAECVWKAWSAHHETVRRWIKEFALAPMNQHS
jgi:uncharacterized protein DUF5946